jgi:polar amino acid transport system substrate-binding protein
MTFRSVIGPVLLAAAILWSGTAPAESRDSIRLTNGEWQPYLSKDVPHFGMASHIITEAFALVEIDVEFGFFPWSRAMKLATDGTWDGSAVWSESEERLQDFFFSDPVVNSSWVFFHLESNAFDWNEYDDLADLKVGGTVSYYYSDAFEAAEAAGNIRVIRGRSDEVGLKNLLKGRIDLFPGELVVTYAQIRDTFAPEEVDMFVHHPKRIIDKPLHLLFSRKVSDSTQMRERFNEGLALLKKSGRYDQILADGLAGKYVKAQ